MEGPLSSDLFTACIGHFCTVKLSVFSRNQQANNRSTPIILLKNATTSDIPSILQQPVASVNPKPPAYSADIRRCPSAGPTPGSEVTSKKPKGQFLQEKKVQFRWEKYGIKSAWSPCAASRLHPKIHNEFFHDAFVSVLLWHMELFSKALMIINVTVYFCFVSYYDHLPPTGSYKKTNQSAIIVYLLLITI